MDSRSHIMLILGTCKKNPLEKCITSLFEAFETY